MDFSKILDEWEKRGNSRRPKGGNAKPPPASGNKGVLNEKPEVDPNRELSHWLAVHGVQDKDQVDAEADDGASDDKVGRIAETKRILAKEPDAVLDLHGMTAREARSALVSFLRAEADSGAEKVLIVHGKGLHSKSEQVLAGLVRQVLESEGRAGAFGPAERNLGGRGATWVRLRKRV